MFNDAVLNMKQDRAHLNGEMVQLKTTTAGHFIINLLKDKEQDDLLIAAFPTEEDDGTILFSDEFEKQLRAPKKKY